MQSNCFVFCFFFFLSEIKHIIINLGVNLHKMVFECKAFILFVNSSWYPGFGCRFLHVCYLLPEAIYSSFLISVLSKRQHESCWWVLSFQPCSRVLISKPLHALTSYDKRKRATASLLALVKVRVIDWFLRWEPMIL